MQGTPDHPASYHELAATCEQDPYRLFVVVELYNTGRKEVADNGHCTSKDVHIDDPKNDRNTLC